MYIILLYSYSVSKGFSILNSYFRLTLHTFRFLLRKCFERMTVSNRRSILDQNPSISNDHRTAERERIERQNEKHNPLFEKWQPLRRTVHRSCHSTGD